MPEFVLNDLIYSDDLESGALRLYIYALNCRGYEFHSYFRKVPKYPEEEICATEAERRATDAIARGCEVRICNGSDFMVFHFDGGMLIHPDSGEKFWEEVFK